MKLNKRLTDVHDLRCHICQDFIAMVAVEDWRNILYPYVQKEVTGRYGDNYAEQYKAMRKKGIENYSFQDMDVPFIVNILTFCRNIANTTSQTMAELRKVKGDRHTFVHSSSNESEEEMCLSALVSLKDLQNFLHVVDMNEITIPDEERVQFVQTYSKKIDALKLDIYNDCIKMFQIKKDVQLILSSENQNDAFLRIYETYMKKFDMSADNKEQLSRFVIAASNAGIKKAHGYAIYDFCYLRDFDEATRRFEMSIDDLGKLRNDEIHQLRTFVNHVHFIGETPTERMKQLVKIAKDQGFDIEETPKGLIWNRNPKVKSNR